jgi:hypothetical protein
MHRVVDHDNRTNQPERVSGLIWFRTGALSAGMVTGEEIGAAGATDEEQQQQ